jgi:dextranase
VAPVGSPGIIGTRRGLCPTPWGAWSRCVAWFAGLALITAGSIAPAGSLITNVNTDNAMYAPGAQVTIYVDFLNSTGGAFDGAVEVAVAHLGHVLSTLPAQALSVDSDASTYREFSWLPPAIDYQGYHVGVTVKNSGGGVADVGASAIDVSSDWARFPRYGYVSHFGEGIDAGNIVWQLKNYHINGLQFYDWQWKHHIPYSPASSWPDIANRTISRAAVTSLIAAAHSYNMVAMSYDDWGAAYQDCLSDGSGVTLSMGRFLGAPASPGNQASWSLPDGWATPEFYLMNNRDPGWQNYIYGRQGEAMANFGFDGWHMDNLVVDHVVFDYAGNQFNLDDYNPEFINNAKAALGKRITFNHIDGSAVEQVAQSANVDFVYSELWGSNAHYADFSRFVDNVRRFGSKASVFAAYMNRGTSSGNFNEASVRLANAAIFACGGAHIELGDGGEMLRTEYFPENRVKMSASLRSAMWTYYDFLVGYENLLRGDTISSGTQATIEGVATSTTGSAGAVWVIAKKTLGYRIVHLVNLLNNTSTEWRDNAGTYPAPPTRYRLAVTMYYTGAIGGGKLWWASPDIKGGSATELSFTAGSDGGGTYVKFTVPQLQYWDMVWLEINGTTGAATRMQAEDYDSMAGIATETTSDTGGGLNVGHVKNKTGDSYVAFDNIDFGSGATSVSARAASTVAYGTIEFRLGSPTGTLIGTAPVGNTGGWQAWQTITAPVSGVSGVQELFVVFKTAASNLNWFTFNGVGQDGSLFVRGDANASNALDIADAVFTLSYLFANGAAPTCLDAADANDSDEIDIADVVTLLSHLFAGGGDLPAPFGQCGIDPKEDDLDCRSFPPCEGP